MKKIYLLVLVAISIQASAQVPSYVPTNGLVGYWPFSGNANDASGNGNNGTVNGATLTTDRFGNANSAYNFDGVNDFIQVQTPSLNNAISISFWAFDEGGYPNSYSLNPRYVSSEFCNGGFALINNVNTPGGIFFTRNRGNTSTEMFASLSPTYQVNQYITFTYDGINGKFYLNGNLINTVTNSGSISQSANIFFGKSGCVFGQMIDAFKGKLDDIGIWNRSLTQQEITNLYNSSLSQTICLPANVPTTGLVGYWPFCGNANDESGNGNNGTVNGATLTTDRFGNSNSAYYFNHTDEITTNYNGISGNQPRTISFWMKNQYSSKTINPIWYGGNPNQALLGAAFNIVFNRNEQNDPCNCWPTTYEGIGISADWIYSLKSTIVGDNQWHHWIVSLENAGDNFNQVKYYKDGVLINSAILFDYNSNGTNVVNTTNIGTLRFGKSMGLSSNTDRAPTQFLDDIGIWNRALTQQEITNLYNANLSINDPVTWANNITIFPNPASSQININFNNFTNLNGGTLKIINSLGQQVATTPITATGTNTSMQLATWGGAGMYFVQIINPQGQIVDIKKIILQ